MLDFSHIPVVELGGLQGNPSTRRALAGRLREICHEIGFLVITDFGVDPSVTGDVFDLMDAFFALPEADKALIDKARSPHFRGWEAVGAEQTNNRVDVREQIDLWSEWPVDAGGGAAYLQLLGPNQWMPDELLPGGRAVMQRWFAELGAVADRLLRLMSVGLGLAEDHLVTYFGDQPMSLTKLINYPPTPAGQAGVNAHHDTGFLTLLATGPVPGLQVQNPSGEWIDVPPRPDGLVVNLGELLQAMTGNYLVATKHRVITDRRRRSAAYFHGPSLDARLDVLPLDASFREAVAASDRHVGAGFMAQRAETEAGVADMASDHRPDTYGEQLWNYFARSYPELMERHYPAADR
ncbi:MAG: 2-oxoglutarate and iron-dependent oxygenase domain-containing protein [Candidatus Microthrix subdominans]|jgi:isopenicillin N synthase-like dioxygenase|uniref:isopenicillin N synthase family dioxygenase n=1 Tax=Candidatus Neomicrothrix sp. TaxID=2719034 RepID=UPI001B61C2BB|nr:2-oxoglutarate and iron-dependent oxygenase domain-containing protein [Candidatus Microthrix sp.]MBP7596310.1 isopenicillin N synthase family oxygenase [Candidatus Microthrix sp.]MBP9067308.1 isopenicillin N synthase family oxygenase [Candidatus Microthrix sp.]HMS47107.1 2-oxoglutarate and iron-dependent oxygenase domain-containing protein [Candidatus Microthrix sp.]